MKPYANVILTCYNYLALVVFMNYVLVFSNFFYSCFCALFRVLKLFCYSVCFLGFACIEQISWGCFCFWNEVCIVFLWWRGKFIV